MILPQTRTLLVLLLAVVLGSMWFVRKPMSSASPLGLEEAEFAEQGQWDTGPDVVDLRPEARRGMAGTQVLVHDVRGDQPIGGAQLSLPMQALPTSLRELT